jgi:hypothetical protein
MVNEYQIANGNGRGIISSPFENDTKDIHEVNSLRFFLHSSNRVGWFYAESAITSDFIQRRMKQDDIQETWRANADSLDAFHGNKNVGYALVA